MSYAAIFYILGLALALSLDAFAASISCGIKLGQMRLRKYLKVSLSYGGFQALTPALGWLVGLQVRDYVDTYASIIAFCIFFVLGLWTLIESRKPADGVCGQCDCPGYRCLFNLSVATSIDAFVAGIALSLTALPIVPSLLIIGSVTFLISMVGCFLGGQSALLLKGKAQMVAGIILIMLAINSLFG